MKTPKYYSQPHDRLRDDCPVKAAIDMIRGRWKPSILCLLGTGTKRYGDLQCALPGITGQVLTVQLRQLVLGFIGLTDLRFVRAGYDEFQGDRAKRSLAKAEAEVDKLADQIDAPATSLNLTKTP